MDRDKHVLMLAERYAPAIGGVEKHLENLQKTLKLRSYRFTIVTASHREGLPLLEERNDCTIIRIPYGQERSILAIWRCLWSARGRITPYDFLHIHDTTPLLFWWPFLFLISPKRPYLTFHGYERDPVPTIWKLVRPLAAKLAKRSLCIGSFIEDIYGIVCDHVSLGAVEERSMSSAEPKGLVYVGRLEPDTGIMSYVEALGILRRRFNLEIPLTICGSGSLAEDVQRIARQENLRITLKGVVDSPSKSIDGKLASFSPGYLSILESMMLGVPVIGIAKTYLRHRYLLAVHKAGGPVSIQTSASGVADEVMRLYEDKNMREKLSRKARVFAEKHSWDKLANLYHEMWVN